PAVQKDWGIILEEAARLERLVRDFEDLAHKREIILELRDMNEVIAKSVEAFKNDFLRGRRREFKLNLSRDRCLVKIDEKLIATALTHLFINSVEATDENGIIHISTNIIGERIIIGMTDNGIGIPAEFLERIFEPFLSTKPGGTGLGLTYVQQIFKEHRGEIKVEGRQGKGTSITISLPRSGGMEI
ncbi:MAG: sensor histidine kinase, partial [Deltaproteobacteria bacterium]|nr:sensor histidine kinase [Deltaproteobacteria bacterium]